MSENTNFQGYNRNLEIFKWIIITTLLTLAIAGNYFYNNETTLIGMLIIGILITAAISIALFTVKGKVIISFIREAYFEIQKVTWPSRRETLYTTLLIIIVTSVISLVLWGLDNVLIRLVSFITNLRF